MKIITSIYILLCGLSCTVPVVISNQEQKIEKVYNVEVTRTYPDGNKRIYNQILTETELLEKRGDRDLLRCGYEFMIIEEIKK